MAEEWPELLDFPLNDGEAAMYQAVAAPAQGAPADMAVDQADDQAEHPAAQALIVDDPAIVAVRAEIPDAQQLIFNRDALVDFHELLDMVMAETGEHDEEMDQEADDDEQLEEDVSDQPIDLSLPAMQAAPAAASQASQTQALHGPLDLSTGARAPASDARPAVQQTPRPSRAALYAPYPLYNPLRPTRSPRPAHSASYGPPAQPPPVPNCSQPALPGPSLAPANDVRRQSFQPPIRQRGRRYGRPFAWRKPTNPHIESLVFQSGGQIDLDAIPEDQRLQLNSRAVREYAPKQAFHGGVKETVREFAVEHNIPALINNPEALAANTAVVDAFLQDLVREELLAADDGDKIAIEVSHEGLPENIFIYDRKENLIGPNGERRAQLFMQQLFHMSQSGVGAFLNDGRFTVTTTRVSGGQGLGKLAVAEQINGTVDHKAVITPKTLDIGAQLCGYQALLLGMLHSQMSNIKKPDESNHVEVSISRDWGGLTHNCKAPSKQSHAQSVWKRRMNLFAESLNLPQFSPSTPPMTTEILADLCDKDAMQEYRVIVIQRPEPQVIRREVANAKLEEYITYDNKNMQAKREVYLEYLRPGVDDRYPHGHYNWIRAIHQYFGWEHNLCTQCFQFFDRPRDFSRHQQKDCSGHCSACACKTSGGSCPEEQLISCPKCNTPCFSDACLARHLAAKRCNIRGYCKECLVHYDIEDGRPHKCDTFYCKNCELEYTDSPHDCIIRPLSDTHIAIEQKRFNIRVYYDIETHNVQSGSRRSDGNPIFDMKPTLLSRIVVCDACENDDITNFDRPCPLCTPQAKATYYGDDCVATFVRFVLDILSKKAKDKNGRVFVFAHNASRFDSQFVLQEIDKLEYKEVRPLFVGNKILKLDIGNVSFMDTCAFIPRPLASLPAALDFDRLLTDEGRAMAKSFFPHLMEKPSDDRADDVIPFPPRELFDEQFMSKDRAREFALFYEEKKDSTFVYRETLTKYCEQDCILLAHAGRKFCQLYTNIAGYNPTVTRFTLAGAALETYRLRCMEGVAIGVPPSSGYFHRRNRSLIGDAWLNVLEMEAKCTDPLYEIKREQRLGDYFVDGIHRESRTVYEFDGCLWHGCIDCQNRRQSLSAEQMALSAERRRQTVIKHDYLRRRGFTLVVMKEHEVPNAPNHPEIKKEHERLKEVYSILDPENGEKVMERDALYGGRTECHAAYYRVPEADLGLGHEIRYIDYVSLYPYCLKNCSYPVGHPTVLTNLKEYKKGDFCGLLHCKIVAPKDLLLPLLPYRTPDDKLLFGLCRTCCNSYTKNSGNSMCTHSEDERAFEGMWCTPEVDKALELGYTIIRVNAALAYSNSKDDMFSSYVNMFLKVKQEASGFPSQNMTEAEKDEFIERYYQAEGIRLEKGSVARNEGLRTIAKLLLNSLWGKFAQRRNQPKTIIARSLADFNRITEDKQLEITAVHVKDNNSVYITHQYRCDEDAPAGNTSPVIAAFVTCHGRLKLYELMQRVLPERILYLDTDSLVYVYKPGDVDNVKEIVGEHLGQVTSEIASGFQCYEAVFAGAKSYYLRSKNAAGEIKEQIKMKGVSQNIAAGRDLHRESMIELVAPFLNPCAPAAVKSVQQTNIRVKDKYTHVMKSMKSTKKFRQTNYKRIVLIGGTTSVPHGYAPPESLTEEVIDTAGWPMSAEVRDFIGAASS